MTAPRKPGAGRSAAGKAAADRPDAGKAAADRSDAGKPGPGRPGAMVAGPGYPVGYGKPPEGSRFRKGVSGNPRGRPKGAKNKLPALNEERLKGLILEEAYRSITVRDGARTVTVPIARAVLRTLAVNAVKGQHRAQRLFAELLSGVETANRALNDDWLDTAMTYKIEWDRELDRRRRLGIVGAPEPLPHPDHVLIDMRKGTARVVGPSTREEKAEWDKWIGRQADFQAELEEFEEMLEAETDAGQIAVITEEIARTRKVLGLIARALGQAPNG